MVRLEIELRAKCCGTWPWSRCPRVLPRLVRLPREERRRDYIFLGISSATISPTYFPAPRIRGSWNFRVTRNSELYIDEEETANLFKAVENELHNRRKGEAVRSRSSGIARWHLRSALLGKARAHRGRPVYRQRPAQSHAPHGDLRGGPFARNCATRRSWRNPPSRSRNRPDLFAAIRERDQLLHHPYENFDTVVRVAGTGGRRSKVLAIKQTLYRTGGDARIIGALMKAVRNGKQVTAVVELRARFDEANNIQWAGDSRRRACTWCTAWWATRFMPRFAWWCGRTTTAFAAMFTWGRATTMPRPRGCTRISSLLTCRPEHGRGRDKPVQPAHRDMANFSRWASCWWRRLSCMTG